MDRGAAENSRRQLEIIIDRETLLFMIPFFLFDRSIWLSFRPRAAVPRSTELAKFWTVERRYWTIDVRGLT
jgi:hypothetical protein